jgi:hypothetical protein
MNVKLTTATALVLGSAMLAAPVRGYAGEPTVEAALAARHATPWPRLGAMVDVGVPDGMIASLVVRPWKWLRGYGGAGSNSVSTGWRGGIALLPFGAGPCAALEYGRYRPGDANGLVRRMTGGEFDGSSLLEKLEYQYANAHLGLEFGGKRFAFFVHGGVSQVWAQLRGSGGTLSGTGADTVVRVSSDPRIKAFGSSLKVGLILFVL